MLKKEDVKKFVSWLLTKIFPEFSNKITMAVVMGGLALMSSSLLERIVSAVLKQEFNINITDGNDGVIGAFVVFLGLSHNILYHREKNKIPAEDKSHIIEHDKEIFSKLNSCLSESELKFFINFVQNNHSYMSNEVKPLYTLASECGQTENSFINDQIEKSKCDFKTALNELLTFLSTAFFVYGPSRDDGLLYFCMYPDFNIDRASQYPTNDQIEAYNRESEKLDELCNKVTQQYKEFRLKVKSNISI